MAREAPLTAALPRTVGLLSIASIVITGLASAAIIVAMPGLLAGMSTRLGLTASQIALINSSEMGGMTAITLVVAAWLGQMDRRRAAFAALLILILGNLVSALASSFSLLVVARLIAGLGAGALQAIVSASIATTPIPDRIFAIYLTANLTATTVLLWLLSLFSAALHPEWLFMIVIAMAIISVALLRWLPVGPRKDQPKTAKAASFPFAYGVSALLGTFILLVGVGLTWPLVGMLGLARHLSGQAVASTLSLATIGGIAASVLVTAGGNRLGRLTPIAAGATGLGIATLMFVFRADHASFAAAAFVFLFCWVLILPYCSGLVATLDPSGRLAVLWITMQFAGLAAGPILAAGLVLSSPNLPFHVAFACFCAAAALMIYAERGSRSAPQPLEDFQP